jgi:hypothetical protein
MEQREVKLNTLYWWQYQGDQHQLVRARFMTREFVTCQVVAATAEDVIRSGYGVGELVNTTPHALRPV